MTEFLHEKGMDLSYRHHLVISMTVFQMNVWLCPEELIMLPQTHSWI